MMQGMGAIRLRLGLRSCRLYEEIEIEKKLIVISG